MNTFSFLFFRKFLYFFIFLIQKIIRTKSRIVILCYHSVNSDNWPFSVSLNNLADHMEYMKKHYEATTLQDLQEFLQGKKKITKPSFIVTFDDGYQNVLKTIPLFSRLGIKPAIFLLANPEKANRKEMDYLGKLIHKEEVQELQEEGWTIGCHSSTHANFSSLQKNDIEDEVVQAKKIFKQNYGIDPTYFAYPKGAYTSEIVKRVGEAGYALAFSMDDELITNTVNVLTIPRVGLMGNHNFWEFTATISPLAILTRKYIKIIKKFIETKRQKEVRASYGHDALHEYDAAPNISPIQ